MARRRRTRGKPRRRGFRGRTRSRRRKMSRRYTIARGGIRM